MKKGVRDYGVLKKGKKPEAAKRREGDGRKQTGWKKKKVEGRAEKGQQ